jgi:hypothetical protein
MYLLEKPGQDKLSSSSRSKFGVIELNVSKELSKGMKILNQSIFRKNKGVF